MVLTSFTKCEGLKTNTKSVMTVKNTSKGASFSYAFKRINDSIKAEYFLPVLFDMYHTDVTHQSDIESDCEIVSC